MPKLYKVGTSPAEIREKIRAAQLNKTVDNEPNQRAPPPEAQAPNRYRWMQVFLKLWMIKQMFALLGLFIPSGALLWNFLFPRNNTINHLDELSSLQWMDLIKKDYQQISQLRYQGMPAFIQNVPLPNLFTVSQTLRTILSIPTASIKVSRNNSFKHFTSDRLWSSALRKYIDLDMKILNPLTYLETLHEHNISSHKFLSFFASEMLFKCQNQECSLEANATDYLYSSYPSIQEYIPLISPNLEQILATQSRQAQGSLWIGR